MGKATFILILIAFALGCSKKEKLLTEQEVFAVINSFDEGWRNKNAELVDSVLSEKYLYFTQSGHTFTRSNIVSTAGSDIYELQTMERENLTMQIHAHIDLVCEKNNGVAVMIEANHTCCSNRGIRHDSTMRTARMSGAFLDNNDNSRAEFYKFVEFAQNKKLI